MSSNKQAECFTVSQLLKREHEAIRALHAGTADEYQQRLALSTIINKFSRATNILYVPGSFDQSSFFSGRAFVGQQILQTLQIPVGQLHYKDDELPPPDGDSKPKKSPKKRAKKNG